MAVKEAAKKAGYDVKVPFAPGRTDASQEQTDVHSFEVMEPKADGFRNYLRTRNGISPEEQLVDKAQLLKLTAPEMTVLIGGMRALNANFGQSKHGVFTKRPGTLTNDFFVNLLDMNTVWQPSSTPKAYMRDAIARRARSSGPALVSISSSVRTRSSARWRKSMPGATRRRAFVKDFAAAWGKVMNNDRYDLAAAKKAAVN